MAKIPSVLIVDPDLDTRSDVKKRLTGAHFALAGESGLGIDAITTARSVQPDVILVSSEEPVAPSLQTLESLGNALPETPIIVYSSLSGIDMVRRTVLAGARDYLPKPVTSADLARSIFAVLEAEETRRRRHARQTENIPAEGIIITVASLKGGVGKTTIAVNLAIALRRETGQSVALVDGEPNFGDVGILMNIDDVAFAQSISQAALRSDQLDRKSVRDYLLPHPTGVMVLPTATQLDRWESVQPAQVQQVVRLIAQTQNYVIVDTPSGFNATSAAALEASALALLVTTPDLTSLKDTMLALNLLKSWELDKEKIKIVMNHTTAINGVRNEDVKRVMEHDIFWSTPHDIAAPTAAQLGQPVIATDPESKISQSITGLARAVSGTRRPQTNSRLRQLLPLW